MKIYLVRHGETDWNQAGRLQGQTDIDLDAQGFAQAAEAAERLKEVPFEIAFCSPLIQGYVMWMGCIYVLVNLLVDISYQWLDPRIRRGALQHEE